MRLTHAKLLLLGNQGAAGPAPFSDDFNRADGALGNGWTGATWAISGNKAVNTPTRGANVVINGTFDADTDWIKGVPWSISDGVATKVAGNAEPLVQSGILAINDWYIIDYATNTAGSISSLGSHENIRFTGGNASYAVKTSLDFNINTNSFGVLDNVVARPLSGLFAYRAFTAGDASASSAITLNAVGAPAGIVHYADDDNYVAAYLTVHLSTRKIYLIKCVAGAITALANVAVTYSAGKTLALTRSGTSYAVAYDGSTLINATAVADAVFVTADKWGLLSSGDNTSFDNFDWVAV